MLFGITALAALAACSANDAPDPSAITAPDVASQSASSTGQAMRYLNAPVCPGSVVGTARCHAWVRVDASGKPVANVTPSGYGPADLISAYGLPSTASATWSWNGQTIAIVDAYDAPSAESDLGVYRSTFGLSACTTANGCFRKINQNGGTKAPRANGGWAQEISLDLDMASAICPNCKILLVEASSNSFANLSAAVDRAALEGATVISNSYGGGEYSSEVNDQSHYNHPGIAITVSSGDNGYGVEFPAASQYVTAVGGTTLRRSSTTRGWTETVWNGAGSGCSAYIAKPSWQKDTGCARRTVADVSAIADPNTGVAVYDSYAYRGASGWMVFGGTSVAAPVVAGVYALGGSGVSAAQSLYSASSSSFFDVTSGSNGSCGGTYLCTGAVGFDGPTGLGTPNGISAF
jgi:subtilase family serine protease